MEPNHKRSITRGFWTLALGMFLGGLLTMLAETFLPDSAARAFLTGSVQSSIGPFSVDLVAVAITIGPIAFFLNVLTIVGIGIVALVVRSWM